MLVKRVLALAALQSKKSFIRGVHNLGNPLTGAVVTIGSFDGVHIGHQAILSQVKQQAERLGLPSVVMVFEPQPQEFFSGERAPARLMRLRDKVDTLLDLGIDQVVCLQFIKALRSLTADEFVENILVKGLATRYLIVGDDFRFGCDRGGDFNMLQRAGAMFDFEVTDTQTLQVEGQRVSSTLVRQILSQSDFARAETLLGRPFSVRGRVVYGQQLGRELGFPTANVQLNRYSAPITGVFAVLVRVADELYQGAANVGIRPTVGGLVKPILEVHLLDCNLDLYGERIEVEFKHKIRDEEKFTSLESLVKNIRRDVNNIRAWFNQANTA